MKEILTKAKGYYKQAKLYWRSKQDIIYPWYSFGRDVINAANNLPEEPRFYNYLHLAWDIKDCYEDTFVGAGMDEVVCGNGEIGLINYTQLATLVRDLLFLYKPDCISLVDDDEECQAYCAKVIGDKKLTWIESEKKANCLYCLPEHRVEILSEIHRLIYQRFPGGKITINGGNFALEEDHTQDKFISFKKCVEMKEYINKYMDKGINRSILFYGPPGSGKSNLIKGIVSELQAKTIKFTDLEKVEVNFIIEAIKCLGPDCIIFEDIDHLGYGAMQLLLEKIEHLNDNIKLLMASANYINELDSALLRPGRFDELIEIKNLDREVLIRLISGDGEDDVELYEMVKDMPVASVKEVLKRIEVLGREEALKSIGDIKARLRSLDEDDFRLRGSEEDEEFLEDFEEDD